METLNALPRPEAEKAIARTVEILDRYTKLYSQLSGGHCSDYPSYMALDGFGDEDEFIKPKLFTDFLEQVLEFGRDEYSPERATAPGVPDFQPVDTLLHPFFFELKGSDSADLAVHLPQVRRYLKPPFDYGVLTNMRDILVYDTAGAEAQMPLLRVSLLELYRAYKSQPKQVLDFPNTKRFLDFVSRFRRQKLDRKAKVERIKHAKDLSLLPKVDPDELAVAIRKVVQILAADARDYKHDLEAELKLPVSRRERQSVFAELAGIARELDHNYARPAQDQPERFIAAREGTLEHRAFDVFLTRVAYFTMIRILLARIWEDVRFIEQQLYDGGFEKWYKTLGGRIREVLRHAFGYAAERYDWLYRPRNNYIWYKSPSENAVIDVLYEFARFNLGTLDSDVLGTVYEQFVDRVDRKNKGQYYTPREVIRFIWDRVGFTDDDAFFNYKDGQREPKMILDIATGSGGFLVEAARRLRTESGCDHADFNGLLEIMMGITQGLCGCEISLFAHHITEVNLLIQLTPVIKEILAVKKEVPNIISTLGLSTVPGDSLGLVSHETLFTNNTTVADRPRELVPKDPKDPIRQMITDCNQFDFVCSNPPYVGEKGHKELFRGTQAEHPYWQRHYQGKMDYLYWFIILGLLKLKEGGKLGFITTSHWPTDESASHLREFILEKAVVHEIVYLGETKVFEEAPGQLNAIFVLERCSDATANLSSADGCPNQANVERKKQHRIRTILVKAAPPPDDTGEMTSLARVIRLVRRHIDTKEYEDEFVRVRYSPITQSELDGTPWFALSASADAEQLLARLEAAHPGLGKLFDSQQGIISSADRVTDRNFKHLPQSEVAKYNVRMGDPIFLLGQSELDALGLSRDDMRIVKPFYQNVDLGSYVAERPPWLDSRFLIYTTRETAIGEHLGVQRHLGTYKAILQKRRECDEAKYPWFSLHRPRDARFFEGCKVVAPHYRYRHPFVYSDGSFYTSDENYVFKKQKDVPEDERYVVGLLNSELIDYWMVHRLGKKASGYEMLGSRLENIPIRRIDFEDKSDVALHDKMVSLVDEMIAAKQELAKLNSFFASRLTRLTGPGELPEPDIEAVTRSLKGSDLRRVQNHPKVKVKPMPTETFVLARVGDVQDAAELFSEPSDEHMYALRLAGKEKQSTTIFAPKEILVYLKKVLANSKGKSWSEIRDIPIARDLATYRAKEKEVVAQARKLLTQVASLQSKIDALAYKLYGLTEDDIKTVEET